MVHLPDDVAWTLAMFQLCRDSTCFSERRTRSRLGGGLASHRVFAHSSLEVTSANFQTGKLLTETCLCVYVRELEVGFPETTSVATCIRRWPRMPNGRKQQALRRMIKLPCVSMCTHRMLSWQRSPLVAFISPHMMSADVFSANSVSLDNISSLCLALSAWPVLFFLESR